MAYFPRNTLFIVVGGYIGNYMKYPFHAWNVISLSYLDVLCYVHGRKQETKTLYLYIYICVCVCVCVLDMPHYHC
jgi:hypothetical protein